MGDKTKAPTKTPTKSTKRRAPTAVTLLIYLENYMRDEDIGVDMSLANVIDRLNDSIVTEAKQRILG